MKFINVLSFASGLALLAGAATAATLPDDPLAKERFEVRARVIGVLPDVSSDVNIGGKVDATNAVAPEFDVSYYFTPHISAELIAATTQHKVTYNGDTSLGKTWILPPTVTAQYHFLPDSAFNPYVGAGLNYSMFYGENSASGFNSLKIDGGVGYALQAGADYWVDKHWGLNLDVKKLFLNVDAKLNHGSIRSDIDLDPWIVGAGVAYRF